MLVVTEFPGYCSRCQRWLSLDSFRANDAAPSGRHWWCRDCVSSYGREWREANAAHVERRNAEMREQYARERGPLERRCGNPDCGRVFVPSRRDAKTCTRECRSHLAYLKRKGRA
jgi:hypothetical protein